MNYNPNSTEVKQLIEGVLQRHFGCSAKEASRDQMYKAAALTIKDFITSGEVFSPFAAFSAVKGNKVKSIVAARKPAISENRDAI